MAKFCPECAHPIVETDMPFCPKCGSELPPSPGERHPPVGKPVQERQPAGPLPVAEAVPAPQPGPGNSGRSFSYSVLFHLVIYSDILICLLFITTIAATFSQYKAALAFFMIVLLCFNLFMDIVFLVKKRENPHSIDSGLCLVKTLAGFLAIFTIIAGLYFLIISILMYRAYRKTAAALPARTAPVGLQKACRGCGTLIPAGSSGYCLSCTPVNPPHTEPATASACRACGAPVPAGETYCSRCTVPEADVSAPVQPAGTAPAVTGEFPAQVTCRACGNRVWPGERYCSRCLVLLPDYTPRDTVPASPPPPPAGVPRPASCPACGNPIGPGDRYCSRCLVLVPAGIPATPPGPAGSGTAIPPQARKPAKPDPLTLMTFREKISYYAPYSIALILMIAGVAVFVFGMDLVSGNRTGHNPTFPFAGLITTAIGSILFSVGLGLTRAIVIAHDRFRYG